MAQAGRDLSHARHSLEGGDFEWACFASHQASEKALKAVYQSLGGEARGHDLDGLLLGLGDRARIPENVVSGDFSGFLSVAILA